MLFSNEFSNETYPRKNVVNRGKHKYISKQVYLLSNCKKKWDYGVTAGLEKHPSYIARAIISFTTKVDVKLLRKKGDLV